MLVTGAGIFVLLLLSAFFSGSETALTAVSRPIMHQLEQEGDVRAAKVNMLRGRKDRLIGAILLGNNLVNILASAVATSFLISVFGEAGVAYATLGMTLLVLIFAEIMPKTYAFKYANRSALAIAPILVPLVALLAPITQGIHWLIKVAFKIAGVEFGKEDVLSSGDQELRGAIELHRRRGAEEVEHHERAMLRSILDLDDVQVGEIMIHRRNMNLVDADSPPAEIVAQVVASPYTRVPLFRGRPDNIVGVLHAKALLRAVRAHGNDLTDLDPLSLAATPWFIPDTTTLLDQLQAFRRRREHFALVVDEYGSLMGVVTLEDILEEIVGDISDEHDIEVAGVRRQGDGRFVVQGDVTIRDLNRQFDWRLPDQAAATIAGLVLHESKRIPEVGQSFIFHGYRFEILNRKRHQITSIRVTPPAK